MSKFKNSPLALRVATVAGALVLISGSAFASPIPITTADGLLVKSNATAQLAVSSNTPCIAFSGIAPACSGTATPFTVTGGSDPIFKALGVDTIKDIASTPITAFESVQLTNGQTAIFDLLSIMAPSGFAACTTSTSSGACSTGTFVLTQISPNQVQIGLALNELGYVGTTAGALQYVGNFQTTISGTIPNCTGANCSATIGNILLWEAGAGHFISSTWSATQSTSPVSGVPEPATLSMMGLGLLSLGLVRRGKKS